MKRASAVVACLLFVLTACTSETSPAPDDDGMEEVLVKQPDGALKLQRVCVSCSIQCPRNC